MCVITHRCNPVEQSRIADTTKEAGIVVTYPATTQRHNIDGEDVTQVIDI